MNLCNLLIKFFLFVVNLIVWLLGLGILALGIYAIILSTEDTLQVVGSNTLSVPGIVLVVLGVFLVVVGFCGWLGALREIFFLLVIYCILLSVVVLLEVAIIILVFVQGGQVESLARSAVQRGIDGYQDDPNLQNLIDQVQLLFQCCGFDGPNDWDRNDYFNCSGPALQSCGVPFSCCRENDNTRNNFQCGYRVREDGQENRLASDINTQGCLTTASAVVMNSSIVLGGIGIGLVVLELINIFLSMGLAVDIYRQKQHLKTLKQQGLIK